MSSARKKKRKSARAEKKTEKSVVDKPGKVLEGVVYEIFKTLSHGDVQTKVARNVFITSPDGEREFDVVVRSSIAQIDITTVIEVRDRSRNLSVEQVDGLRSKMLDVNANKAILVARKGFSKTAIQKAKRHGIDLCTAHNIDNLKDFKTQAPVVVHYLRYPIIRIPQGILPRRITKEDFKINRIISNGVPVIDILREEIASGAIKPKIGRPLTDPVTDLSSEIEVGKPIVDLGRFGDLVNIWKSDSNFCVRYVHEAKGIDVEIDDFEFKYMLQYEYYFGYLSDLPGTVALDNISTSRANVFYDPNDIANFQERFTRFTKFSDIPVKSAVNFHFLETVGADE